MNNVLTIHGQESISVINSWRAWSKILSKRSFSSVSLHLNENGFCEDCNNRGWINESTYGKIRCICNLKKQEVYLEETKRNFESVSQKRTLDEFLPWGDAQNKSDIVYVKKEVEKWIANPTTWLTMVGNNGCGKTLILHAINNLFSPWSLYLSFPDLEQLYFESMNDEDDGALNALIDRISRHPIVLFDDIGADHGSKFAKSTTQKILDFRYRAYEEFPTVITTNLGRTPLRAYDMRLGDRIFDENQNTIIDFKIKSLRAEQKQGLR
jgi:DNA replication protein DnaC